MINSFENFMGNIKQSGQTMILRCDGCFTVSILIFKDFDFGFEKTIPNLHCHVCGMKKYTRKDTMKLSLTSNLAPTINCKKCNSDNIAMLGNQINLCLNCFEFFKV